MRGIGLDSIDARIITHLQEDGRRPYTTIARDLGISEASVRQRVSRLLKRKVIQIVAASSPLDLGLLSAQIDIRVAGDRLQQAAAGDRRAARGRLRRHLRRALRPHRRRRLPRPRGPVRPPREPHPPHPRHPRGRGAAHAQGPQGQLPVVAGHRRPRDQEADPWHAVRRPPRDDPAPGPGERTSVQARRGDHARRVAHRGLAAEPLRLALPRRLVPRGRRRQPLHRLARGLGLGAARRQPPRARRGRAHGAQGVRHRVPVVADGLAPVRARREAHRDRPQAAQQGRLRHHRQRGRRERGAHHARGRRPRPPLRHHLPGQLPRRQLRHRRHGPAQRPLQPRHRAVHERLDQRPLPHVLPLPVSTSTTRPATSPASATSRR